MKKTYTFQFEKDAADRRTRLDAYLAQVRKMTPAQSRKGSSKSEPSPPNATSPSIQWTTSRSGRGIECILNEPIFRLPESAIDFCLHGKKVTAK